MFSYKISFLPTMRSQEVKLDRKTAIPHFENNFLEQLTHPICDDFLFAGRWRASSFVQKF